VSSFTLALEGPGLDPNSNMAFAMRILDIVYTTVFTGEMVLKWVALGVVFPPKARFSTTQRSMHKHRLVPMGEECFWLMRASPIWSTCILYAVIVCCMVCSLDCTT